MANQLQVLINQEDSKIYYTTVPYNRVCAEKKCSGRRRCTCVSYKYVKKPAVVYPFRRNQKIGAVTLEAEEEEIEIFE